MKVYHSHGTLHIYLSRETGEVERLNKEGWLETALQDMDTCENLGKKVVFVYDHTTTQRSNVSWVPQDASWDDLHEIHFSIGPLAYADLLERRKLVERYAIGNVHVTEEDTDGMM